MFKLPSEAEQLKLYAEKVSHVPVATNNTTL